ncbi:MAG: hypothetical protein K2W96_24010, partial [Gemmataceae bacterium]|nr:hypothetical protein [Gemmataceae bacterium]
RLIREMDKAVGAIVRDADALGRYRAWRDTTDRTANALVFLTTADELRMEVPKRLKDAGYFGEPPDHVLTFDDQPLGMKEGKRPRLVVLAFQAERLRDKVLDKEGPFRSDDKKLPAIDYFWQAGGLVFSNSEGRRPGGAGEVGVGAAEHAGGPAALQGTVDALRWRRGRR